MYAIRSYYVFVFAANPQPLFGIAIPGHTLQKKQMANFAQDDATQLGVARFRLDEFAARITSYNVCYTKLLRKFLINKENVECEKRIC